MEEDVRYFARRASEEREAAMRSTHLKARRAHLEIAGRYADLATSIESRERFLALDLNRVVGL
jgi:hypothetical protein